MSVARVALALFLSGVLIRLAVCATTCIYYDIPIDRYAAKGDGESYLAYASAILGDSSHLREYDRRVFPGYPALIAMTHVITRLPLPHAALAIDFFSAGAAAALAWLVFKSREIGIAMLVLIPHYVINSSMAMSEAPMLALALFGIWLVTRWSDDMRAIIAGGAMFGAAGLVRPMACFAALGAMYWLLRNRKRFLSLSLGLVSLAVVALGLLALKHNTGDAFTSIRLYRDLPGAYGGQLFGWPFQSLIATPMKLPVSGWKLFYLYIHVAIALVACTMSIIESRKDDRAALAMPWFVGNTLFALCTGSVWGCLHFHRFTIPAQPAMFFSLRRALPRAIWIWAIIGAVCFVNAVIGVNASP